MYLVLFLSCSVLNARIESIHATGLCGLSGYCIQTRVNEAVPTLFFNIYVFEPVMGDVVLRPGDYFNCSGKLYAVPERLVSEALSQGGFPISASDTPVTHLASEWDAVRLFISMMEKQAFDELVGYVSDDLHYFLRLLLSNCGISMIYVSTFVLVLTSGIGERFPLF